MKLYLVMFGSILAIYAYKVIDPSNFLGRYIFKVNDCFYFTFWSLSHFLLYAAVAFFFPDQLFAIIALSVSWELLEMVLDHVDIKIGLIGNISDFLTNQLGILAGLSLAKLHKYYSN